MENRRTAGCVSATYLAARLRYRFDATYLNVAPSRFTSITSATWKCAKKAANFVFIQLDAGACTILDLPEQVKLQLL
jgi:hypothetical protein